MAVPKKRTTSSKRNMRRSHHGLKSVKLTPCPRCKTPIPGHVACYNCGTYKKREVIDVAKVLEKKEKREKEKAQQQG